MKSNQFYGKLFESIKFEASVRHTSREKQNHKDEIYIFFHIFFLFSKLHVMNSIIFIVNKLLSKNKIKTNKKKKKS